MFGWLANRSTALCDHAPLPLVSRRIRQITPALLVRQLPALGSVLYLHAASAYPCEEALPTGVMVTELAFAPLLETRWLIATGLVTDDGPREWIECVDSIGRMRARLHLLPDTDYLAWDALMSSPEPDRVALASTCMSSLRADRASVVHFQARELGGLLLLEQSKAVALSPLGGRVAARIASAESTVLVK